jgi:hypothetical protein
MNDALARRFLFVGVIESGRLNLGRTNFASGDTVFFAGPLVEIDQLATLGTEWTRRIVLPLNRLSTGWTFMHKAKVRRKKIKVKAGRKNLKGRLSLAPGFSRVATGPIQFRNRLNGFPKLITRDHLAEARC